MDIEFLGFDHGVVHVLAVPGSVNVLVGSLFLTFWDKVFVSSSRAQQDMKNVIGEWTAGMFVRSGQFRRAKFVAVRPTFGQEVIVLEMPWFVFCIQNCVHFHHVKKVTTDRFLFTIKVLQLHILLFPQCKPTAINQLTVLIESLRVSVTLMATCLI